MMKILKGNLGLTLLELLVSGALIGVISCAFGSGYFSLMKLQNNLLNRKDIDQELVRAFNDVLRVGRIAQNCVSLSKKGVWLECQVDMGTPPTGANLTTFRFGMGNKFQWQKQDSNGNFFPYMEYDFITDFEICDDARMEEGCSILPANINTAHLINIKAVNSPTSPNHFFRFQFKASTKKGEQRRIQSSFALRHPAPGGVIYQWGQWENPI